MYHLQQTRIAFLDEREVPPNYWYTVSRHRTRAEAEAELAAHRSAMWLTSSSGRGTHNHRIVEEA